MISAQTVAWRRGLVPQDFEVEGGEQLGFDGGVHAGQDVTGHGQLVEEGEVAGFGGVVAWRVASWAVTCSRCWWSSTNRSVIRARMAAAAVSAGSAGSCFEAEDLGVLRGVDLLEPGSQGGGLVVTVGGRVGGGEPGGEQLGLLGAEDVLGEEQADDLVQPPLRAFDRAGMIRVAGGVGGTGRVRGHS